MMSQTAPTRKHPARRSMAIIALAAALAAGCGSDDSDAEASRSSPASASEPDTTSGSTGSQRSSDDRRAPQVEVHRTMYELLDALPALAAQGSGPVILRFADVDRAAEIEGTSRDADGSYAALYSGAGSVLVETPAVLGWNSADLDPIRDELGWDMRDVRWIAERVEPVDSFALFGVDVDAADLTPGAGPAPADGIWRLGPDQDLAIDAASRTAARPTGSTLRFGFTAPDVLAVARSTDWVRALVAEHDGPSVAEASDLGALADALDDADVYAAVMVLGENHSLEGVLPVPFVAVSYGQGARGDDRTVAIAYLHDSAADANTNADAIEAYLDGDGTRARWASQVAASEVTVDGAVVTVELTLASGGRATLGAQMWTQREPIFYHR